MLLLEQIEDVAIRNSWDAVLVRLVVAIPVRRAGRVQAASFLRVDPPTAAELGIARVVVIDVEVIAEVGVLGRFSVAADGAAGGVGEALVAGRGALVVGGAGAVVGIGAVGGGVGPVLAAEVAVLGVDH